MDNKRTYEECLKEFKWEPPARFNFARDVIDPIGEENPDKVAIEWVDDFDNRKTLTFKQITDRSCQLANALGRSGLRRGDTVILILGRQIEWWEALTACIRMGVVCSPGTTQLSPKDVEYRVNAAKARAVITDLPNSEKVDEVGEMCPTLEARVLVGGDRDGWLSYDNLVDSASNAFETADTAFDENALCYFTSGTTGYPKMTIHNHGYGLAHEITGKYWLDLNADDLHWNISDTGWAKAAYSSYFGPWIRGAALFVHHSNSFDPVKTLKLLADNPVTTMCGAPTIYRMLVQLNLSELSFPHLRHCVGAGEPLNPEVIETWLKATGIVIRDGYGQTETVLCCGNFPFLEPRFGSMGKPMPGMDMAIIDSDGKTLPADTEGDIAIRVKPMRAPGLFTDYKGDPERYQSCFVGDWYITGDRGYQDSDGYFWFVSRADDVILSAGYRIGPFEVESALIEHPAVAESAVVASPDETRGALVKAFVVLADGHEGNASLTKELQDHVKEVTAPYKYPRKIQYVDELPKTVSGKIRRVELRELESK